MKDLSFYWILIGWIVYVILCFIKGQFVLHIVVGNKPKNIGSYKFNTCIKGQNFIIKICIILVQSMDFIFKILFPNWIISDYCKWCIKKSFDSNNQIKKDRLKEYITTMNYLNLLISVIYLLILSYLIKIECEWDFLLFLFILILRAFSRSYEIIKAFSHDVLNASSVKSSSLRYYDRLRLALSSLVEVAINYSFVYYLWTENLVLAFRDSIQNSLLVDVSEINLVSLFQVLTSMTLIYLALADYIGSKDERRECE